MKHPKSITKGNKTQRTSSRRKARQIRSPYLCILMGRALSTQKAMDRLERAFARSVTSWYTAARIPLFYSPSQASQKRSRDKNIRYTIRWINWVNRASLGIDC